MQNAFAIEIHILMMNEVFNHATLLKRLSEIIHN